MLLQAPRWMTESTVDAFKDTATTPSTSERKPVITETDSKPLNDEVMQVSFTYKLFL